MDKSNFLKKSDLYIVPDLDCRSDLYLTSNISEL